MTDIFTLIAAVFCQLQLFLYRLVSHIFCLLFIYIALWDLCSLFSYSSLCIYYYFLIDQLHEVKWTSELQESHYCSLFFCLLCVLRLVIALHVPLLLTVQFMLNRCPIWIYFGICLLKSWIFQFTLMIVSLYKLFSHHSNSFISSLN